MRLFVNEALTEATTNALQNEGITLIDNLEEATVAWVRLRDFIGPELMDRAPHLRFIVSATTGLNHIDTETAKQRGIEVLSLRGEHEFLQSITATAEHTIALMLALLRRIPESFDAVRRGSWERVIGRELAGKVCSIIGEGRVGTQVWHLMAAFHADLTGNPTQADIVSLHVNYTPENEKMCDEAFFASLKPGALFINTARGELVDEEALLDALARGQLGGAALDVLADESRMKPQDVYNERGGKWTGHGLRRYAAIKPDRLINTPHSGGATVESMEKTELFMVGKLMEASK